MVEPHSNLGRQLAEIPVWFHHTATVGLINIAAKTPAPVPLGEGLPILSSKEWWNPMELELEFWLKYL